jgi:hypothetical protein
MKLKLTLSILIPVFIACFFLVEIQGVIADTGVQSSDQGKKVQELLSVLRDENLRERSQQEVVKAINKLGELRSREAIDDLVSLLSFKQTFMLEEEAKSKGIIERIHVITPDTRYPAIGALICIGKPALSSLINVVQSQEEGTLESENAIYSITEIFRADFLEGVDYMRQAASQASSIQSQQRLQKLVAKLESAASKHR